MSEREPAEHHLQVPRTARYWTLGAESDVATTQVWFVLHGYRQLARRFVSRFRNIAGPGRVVVAPEGLSRFYIDPSEGEHGPESRVGATWMTREDRLNEIRDYVAYLDLLAARFGPSGRLEAEGRAVTVLGFSQGAHTATRWAALGQTRIGRVILWGAGLPKDLPPSEHDVRLGGVRFTLVRGQGDAYHTEASQMRDAEVLRAAAIDVEVRTHPGGHEIGRELLKSIAGTPMWPASG